ncbi:uncharacterized protein (DUF1697 family) [Paenibacillus rhizosphaerae]|uniref:Uncharacterized protein (DUF1697 family) n=1 Tax=Paenibacillus rhizosphaerae TaxID=297318 RepID=A0A839TTJ4_9BACL|nr:DUF1697 domain-containing protein [Paenibacillus rhizosphaerae]MBB3128027.1 uncharacterized protein (DUF1697 family) [Paenibacillus rhizosphaerae]
MTVYIALLRGINVGGHNLVKMTELKKMFENMGFHHVKTYIQSGNVLFKSDEEPHRLKSKIEQFLEKAIGKPVSVALKSAEDMQQIIARCPFDASAVVEGESIHVSLLTEQPSQEGLDKLAAFDKGGDDYHIDVDVVYLMLRQSIRDSKLAANLSKLGVPATARNWNTMNKLNELAKTL